MSKNSTGEDVDSIDEGHETPEENRRDGDEGELGFAGGDLGRIQGILLGDHARRIDTRFNEQEAQLDQRLQQLIADLGNTNQTLRGEIEVLKTELAEERAARLESMRLATEERAAFSHEMDEFKKAVGNERTQADAALAGLRADSIANVDDLGSRLDDEVTKINTQFANQGVHRNTLSQILREAADRVGDEESRSDSE